MLLIAIILLIVVIIIAALGIARNAVFYVGIAVILLCAMLILWIEGGLNGKL